MKYLLDTNIIVDYLRGKTDLPESFIKEGSAISSITLAELYYGAYKSKNPHEGIKEISEILSDFDLNVIELQDGVKIYGRIKASLESKGTKLDEMDLLIAATAMDKKLTLVTKNIKHFSRIPKLKIKKGL